MDRSNVLYLRSKTYDTDSMGQRVPRLMERRVFCDVRSVGQTEFFEAGRNGLQAALQVVMLGPEYQGETECRIDDKLYRIYRTYKRRTDEIELYLESRVGV